MNREQLVERLIKWKGEIYLYGSQVESAKKSLAAILDEHDGERKYNDMALQGRLVEISAILESVSDALDGKEVSDFMMSFPIVRQAWDTVQMSTRTAPAEMGEDVEKLVEDLVDLAQDTQVAFLDDRGDEPYDELTVRLDEMKAKLIARMARRGND